MALKAEVPRLDHARMNRANCHLVDLLPFNSEEVHDSNEGNSVLSTAPSVVRRSVARMETHRFEPRMTLGDHAPLFGDLPLEEMHLMAFRCHRRKSIARDQGPSALEKAAVVIGQDHEQREVVATRCTKKSAHSAAVRPSTDNCLAKRAELETRNLRKRHGRAIRDRKEGRSHRPVSTYTAATRNAASSAGGTQTPSIKTTVNKSSAGPTVPKVS